MIDASDPCSARAHRHEPAAATLPVSKRHRALRERARFLPLFLVSAACVGYETALTRYFAVAKWSEYGYWIISIVMAGFALSGVTVAVARRTVLSWRSLAQQWLPVALIGSAALGFWATTGNPFNPLQLQNATTWRPQLADIALYYAYLLPFFFLAGLYISLTFVLNAEQVATVYGYDLTGAGFGALLVLVLMRVLHPFQLVPALLVPLALAALSPGRWPVALATLAMLAGSEGLLLTNGHADYNDFKAIYAPLHVPGSQVLSTLRAPRGFYTVLDDFTERVDTDISNDAGLLRLPGPPTALGLYRDGNRIAALPRPGPIDARYAPATLAALSFVLRPKAAVLLIGPSGGFRIAEALTLGAASVTAVEPDPVLLANEHKRFAADARVRLNSLSPVAQAHAARAARRLYDVIDIAGDFLDEAEANAHAFTAQAVTGYLAAVRPDGLVSIPVSIREFPAYAVRMLATIRAGLLQAGIDDPAAHVVVVRSAWSVRILISPRPWTAASIAQARAWADDRSFDVSFYPGIDVVAARAGIYNDLPAVSFERGQMAAPPSASASDALADEAGAVLTGRPTPSQRSFDLSPITEDRPYYYDVLRLTRLPLLLRRIEILPQAEIAPLVNVAVLLQAVVLAGCVLALPALAQLFASHTGPGSDTRRRYAARATYFAALGLGFLFIEIAGIEKAAFLLNDRATAFALVLTAMLVFSGLGSLLSARVSHASRQALGWAVVVVIVWCAGLMLAGDMVISLAGAWPGGLREALVVGAIAPVSVALGMPFPLGLAQTQGEQGFVLPWAWALNGAFSVVATPLANLAALSFGLRWVLFAAIVLYGLCYTVFPARKSLA